MPPDDTDAGHKLLKLRPAYVVVFHERSELNTGRLSEALKLKPAAMNKAREAVDLFASHQERLPDTRVYQRLGLAVGSFSPEQLSVLRRHEDVAAVELNQVRRLPPTRYAQAITPTVAPDGNPNPDLTWCLTAIGVAPDGSTPTGQGVKVAVLDTGLDFDHPDFAGRVDPSHGKSFVHGVATAQDDHGHGTHCCGIVAGAPLPHGGGPRFSVAPDAELIVGKVLDKHEEGTDDHILDGIDWAVTQGAKLISLSLGSPRAEGAPYSMAYETIAKSVGKEGVLLICAAGNDSERDLCTRPVNNPAACPSIMAVAALDRFDRITPYSAACMDAIGRVAIGAPGDGVNSCWIGGDYRMCSGTSMATPHVVGVAAMLLQLDPSLAPEALAHKLGALARQMQLTPQDSGAGLATCPAHP